MARSSPTNPSVGGMQLFRTESSDRSAKLLPSMRALVSRLLYAYLGERGLPGARQEIDDARGGEGDGHGQDAVDERLVAREVEQHQRLRYPQPLHQPWRNQLRKPTSSARRFPS